MKKQRRKKIEIRIYIVVAFLVLIVSVSSFSYALWTTEHKQSGVSNITTGCFNIDLEEGDAINLTNSYPIPDEAGLGTKGYKFTIKNTCTIAAKYTVYLNISTLANNASIGGVFKYYVDGQNIKSFNSAGDYTLLTGVLGPASKQGANDSQRSYTLKMWYGQDDYQVATSAEYRSSTINGKLKVSSEQVSKTSNNLAEKIIANNEIKTQIPTFTQGEPPTSGSSATGSGLFSAEDDNGTSYYFRGDKTLINNYVHFADQYWRIVRINGDGTIRLILDDKLSTTYAFNSSSNERKYVGYTYDNDACTLNSPCWSTHTSSSGNFTNSHNGTNSNIKSQLEIWYNSKLSGNDSKIAYGTYCNDTSYGSGVDDSSSSTMNYGPYERLNSSGSKYGNPTLKCPEPKDANGIMRTYGGIYKLKIGLLSADEMNYAGLPFSGSASSNNYLYKNYYWWGLSPYSFHDSNAFVFGGYSGYLYSNIVDITIGVRPVINLTTETLTTSGDGSTDSPYEVE